MARTETVCHRREVSGELLATRIVGAQMVSVRISLWLSNSAEPKAVVWQTLGSEEASNLIALFDMAAPKWNEVISAERKAMEQSQPAS